MRVIRISLQGTVTSFRYPHIHLGRQPSFPMPPPATVYGHICSAIGDWIPPDSARFAYSFQCDGTGDDLELLHMAQVSSGRLDKGWGYVKNLEVQTNVLPREILLHPRLILYVDAGSKTEEWVGNFRSPRYPVLLGRSQDLAAYESVELVELEQSDFGYFEGTLLPWSMRDRLPDGTTFQMPKFVNPEDRRRVSWDRYIALERRVWWPAKGVAHPPGARIALRHDGENPVWLDPLSPLWGEGRRIVVWHSWV